MPLIKRDPFDTFLPLRDAMDRLFEESFIAPGRFEFFTFNRAFPVDIYEIEDHTAYMVEASLPGVKPEDLQITVMGDTLTIKTANKEEKKVEKEAYVRREHHEGEMSRTFTLPGGMIDPEKVEATYEHGKLFLRIPKAEEVKPKQIPLKIKELTGATK
jgi:HSP20 family protein